MANNKQFLLVVYDISVNARRRRLHQLLTDFGSAVQFSVFECYLSDDDIIKMNEAISRVIKPRKDRVRIYYLCQGCVKKTKISSGKEILTDAQKTIVI